MNCREHFKPEFVNFLVRKYKNRKGDPLSFRSHYFLLDIYQDFSLAGMVIVIKPPSWVFQQQKL